MKTSTPKPLTFILLILLGLPHLRRGSSLLQRLDHLQWDPTSSILSRKASWPTSSVAGHRCDTPRLGTLSYLILSNLLVELVVSPGENFFRVLSLRLLFTSSHNKQRIASSGLTRITTGVLRQYPWSLCHQQLSFILAMAIAQNQT